jgi:hypothetical protein
VKELLFGYNDELLATVSAFLPAFASSSFVSLIPNTAPSNARQRTTMATGAREGTARWQYLEWQGLASINCWPDGAEALSGASDGSQFPPRVARGDALQVFVPEVFRLVEMTVDGSVRPSGECLR